MRRRRELYRAHHRGFGAWWFASDRQGRFNLDSPCGTCYLAIDEETALRERLGPTTGVVSYGWADETQVFVLEVQHGGRCRQHLSQPRDPLRNDQRSGHLRLAAPSRGPRIPPRYRRGRMPARRTRSQATSVRQDATDHCLRLAPLPDRSKVNTRGGPRHGNTELPQAVHR